MLEHWWKNFPNPTTISFSVYLAFSNHFIQLFFDIYPAILSNWICPFGSVLFYLSHFAHINYAFPIACCYKSSTQILVSASFVSSLWIKMEFFPEDMHSNGILRFIMNAVIMFWKSWVLKRWAKLCKHLFLLKHFGLEIFRMVDVLLK